VVLRRGEIERLVSSTQPIPISPQMNSKKEKKGVQSNTVISTNSTKKQHGENLMRSLNLTQKVKKTTLKL
jgi:hypothetical protein